MFFSKLTDLNNLLGFTCELCIFPNLLVQHMILHLDFFSENMFFQKVWKFSISYFSTYYHACITLKSFMFQSECNLLYVEFSQCALATDFLCNLQNIIIISKNLDFLRLFSFRLAISIDISFIICTSPTYLLHTLNE